MAKRTQREDGRFSAKISTGDGKYKYVYAATEKELEKKIREVEKRRDRGLDLSADRDSFDSWGKRWLSKKQLRVSENWYNALTINYKKLESIYSCDITRLRTIDLEEILDSLAVDGYSARVIKAVRDIASGIMDMAVNNRVIDYNPFTMAELPNAKPKRITERRALTKEEQQWIIDTPHRARTAAMIMMYAGLRRGELLALQWTDIDLENGTISVNKSVVMHNGQPTIKKGGKTANAERVVYIPSRLVEYLKAVPRDNFLVVSSASGKPMSDSAWRRLWDSYIKDLNLKYGNFGDCIKDGKPMERPKSKCRPGGVPIIIPQFTAHWLRHTFITLMYFSGMDVYTAAQQAGHGDVKVTMQIYTHLNSEYKIKNIEKLNFYLLDGCQLGCQNIV